MDTEQIAALSNQHIISLLFLILSELARRLGVPVFAVPSAAASVEVEAGDTPTEPASSSHSTCCFGCAVPGCYKWCELAIPHERHRCWTHSWD